MYDPIPRHTRLNPTIFWQKLMLYSFRQKWQGTSIYFVDLWYQLQKSSFDTFFNDVSEIVDGLQRPYLLLCPTDDKRLGGHVVNQSGVKKHVSTSLIKGLLGRSDNFSTVFSIFCPILWVTFSTALFSVRSTVSAIEIFSHLSNQFLLILKVLLC